MLNKQLYLTLLHFLFAWVLFAQSSAPIFEWARGIRGSDRIEGTEVTTDDLGNVYVTGKFKATADFDPSPTSIFNLTSNGDYDTFIQKLDAQGNLVWAKSIGGSGTDYGTSITLDDSGNVFITGGFNDTVDFNPNIGVNNMVSSATGAFGRSGFILKLDTAGTYIWSYGINCNSGVGVQKVAFDSLNNIFTTGVLYGTADFDSGSGVSNITSIGSRETYILKITSSGNFSWVKSIGGTSGAESTSVTVVENDEILIAGTFTDSVDFNPGSGVSIVNSAGFTDGFILKLTNSGSFIWVKTYGGTNGEYLDNLVIDNNKNIIVTGRFGFGLGLVSDFDPDTSVYVLSPNNGTGDHYVLSLDSAGSFNWASSVGGPTSFDFAEGVSVDEDNNVYSVGNFRGTADFDPGIGIHNLTSTSTYGDMFIQKLDSNGGFVWAKTFTGSLVYGMALDSAQNIHMVGSSTNTTDFDPGSGFFNLFPQSAWDGFVSKYSQCHATTSTLWATVCNSYTSPSGNHTWYATGMYHDTLSNLLGCDSIITIHLTANKTYNTISPAVCSVYVSPSGLYSWVNSGTYHDTLTNSIGCDSILTINLSVNSNDTLFATLSCGAYTSPSGNYTWTTAGVYQDTMTNSLGCDSVISIILSIGTHNTGSQSIASCISYLWPVNGVTFTSTGLYYDTLVNASGCDSIINLDLTINSPTSATDVITSCTEITWIDGITYNQTTNGQTFTIPNSNGCDSVVTLDFTLIEVETSVNTDSLKLTAVAQNATYQWLDCDDNFKPIAGETSRELIITQSGNYAVEVTENGCSDTSACYAFLNVSIQDPELIGISLYPNPTSDVLNIDKGTNTSLEITVTNSAGAIVHQSTTQNQITTINMAQMATGMYVVTLKNELGMKVGKVVKR